MRTKPGINRRHTLGLIGGAGLAAALPTFAQADFPSRPLRIVVGLPAGGAADVVVRAIAREMEQSMKQSVVIENRPGGLYQLAVQAVSAAPADGHTLMYVNSSFVAVQAIQKRFDLTRQFMPLTKTGETPGVIVVHPNSPFKSIKDLIEYGRANPDQLTYGTLGAGTYEHVKALQFTEGAGFRAKAIPYKGGPDMINAVIAGDLSYTSINIFTAMQFIPSGRLRPLVAVDSTRLKALPDVPTIREAGFNVPTSRIWSGFVVHANTPAPISQKLFKEVVAASNAPSVVEKLAPLGMLITTSKSPQEFRDFITTEAEWMGALAHKVQLDSN
jgi:tripartite-type tricarboxylate transporter receptor subunit TctC